MYQSNNSSMKSLLKAGENIITNPVKYKLNNSSSVKSLRSQETLFTSRLKSSMDNSQFSKDSFEKNYQNFHNRSPQSFINEANKILRDRIKNKGSPIYSKSKIKKVVINESKEIALKNYIINLLREKRTNINNKEVTITKALKVSENKFDNDYKSFVDYIEDLKKKQKKEEEELQSIKLIHENNEKIFKKELNKNKKLTDLLEKTVKSILLLKNYGSFVHKVLGLKFELDNIENKERNYELFSNTIIEKYEKMDTSEIDKIIEDHNYMIVKFNEFEDKVIKKLEIEDIINIEKRNLSNNYDDEIKELRNRYEHCYKEAKKYENEKNQIIHSINKLKKNEDSEAKNYIDYILELGFTTNELTWKAKKKDNITDLLNFINDIMKNLKQKEIYVNEYIAEIENIEINGDSNLIYEIEMERKKNNKKEKQLIIKQNREHLENLKRLKSLERAQRVIIKGRMVPKIYPILKKKKKKNNENKKNENNEFDMLFYSSEEN